MFELILPFAGYAFNKAHSVSYAMISYWTAYLKANYPVEFMTALLTCHPGQSDHTSAAVEECRKLGIQVLRPDINMSDIDFTMERDNGSSSIRFGLSAVKNVGDGAVRPLVEARQEEGPFKSVEDMCRRANLHNLNKRALESLIKVGALDSLEDRGSLLGGIDRILSMSQRESDLKNSGQTTMFDLWGASVATPLPELELERIRIQPGESETWEKELLGASLSESPISRIHRNLGDIEPNMCGDISPEQDGQKVKLVGQLSSFRTGTTRRGDPFGAAVLEDISGSIEVVAWKEVYQRTQALWVDGSVLIVEGRVRLRNGDRVSVHCNSVIKFESARIEDESPIRGEVPAHPEPTVETFGQWDRSPQRHSCGGRNPSPAVTRGTPPQGHRHSCERNPSPAVTGQVLHPTPPPTVIPEAESIPGRHPRSSTPPHPPPSFLRMAGIHPLRSPHPPTPSVIPAEAGIHLPPTTPGEVWLKIRATGDDTQDAEVLKDAITIARQCPGPSALFLEIEERSRITHLEVPGVQVEYSPRLVKLLSPRLGDGAITLAGA